MHRLTVTHFVLSQHTHTQTHNYNPCISHTESTYTPARMEVWRITYIFRAPLWAAGPKRDSPGLVLSRDPWNLLPLHQISLPISPHIPQTPLTSILQSCHAVPLIISPNTLSPGPLSSSPSDTQSPRFPPHLPRIPPPRSTPQVPFFTSPICPVSHSPLLTSPRCPIPLLTCSPLPPVIKVRVIPSPMLLAAVPPASSPDLPRYLGYLPRRQAQRGQTAPGP